MIDITQDFDNPNGQYEDIDSYDLNQRNQLLKQKHVDIRSFQQSDIFTQVTMLNMDLATMSTLDNCKMNSGPNSLEGNIVLVPGEQWTSGVIGKQSDRKNWLGISLACTTANQNVTSSVLRK